MRITLTTSPTGLQVVYGGERGTAPITRTTVAGSSHTILAPSPQGSLVFQSWSDGGAQQHDVQMGTTGSDMTYRATFGPGVETTPPVISNVTATNITRNSVTITWTTSEPADSQVDYGTSTS